MWFILALGSAVFAALTSILAKIGIDGVNSTLATAIRTVVVLAMSWGMVFLTNAQSGSGEISRRSWIFLILSGIATGASWLCYYRALQVGQASKVVPIDKLSVVITMVLAAVILLPMAIFAFLRLRKRNLTMFLEAGGWAVNLPMRLSMSVSRIFTRGTLYPHGSRFAVIKRSRSKRAAWIITLILLAVIAGAVWYLAAPECINRLFKVLY